MTTPHEIERRVEALLFAASAPLTTAELAARLPDGADVEDAIAALRERYIGRGVELDQVAGRWRFRTAEDLGFLMTEQREEPRRLSRAPARIATSTNRAELDEFLDPTTSTRSQPAPSRFTASWRLVVA